MRIGIAQTKPVAYAVDANMAAHRIWIEKAAAAKTELLFFPELSLLGYEPKRAAHFVIDVHDSRLDALQALCDAETMTVGVGAPTRGPTGIRISMIVMQPRRPRLVYSKQHLHADELPYFVNGHDQVLLAAGDELIAPAICYESLLPEHSDQAAASGATIYVASVAKSARGIAKAAEHYPSVASRYSMPVLMANSLGPCDDFESVGRSAIWGRSGALLAELGSENEGLLMLDTDTERTITIEASASPPT